MGGSRPGSPGRGAGPMLSPREHAFSPKRADGEHWAALHWVRRPHARSRRGWTAAWCLWGQLVAALGAVTLGLDDLAQVYEVSLPHVRPVCYSSLRCACKDVMQHGLQWLPISSCWSLQLSAQARPGLASSTVRCIHLPQNMSFCRGHSPVSIPRPRTAAPNVMGSIACRKHCRYCSSGLTQAGTGLSQHLLRIQVQLRL